MLAITELFKDFIINIYFHTNNAVGEFASTFEIEIHVTEVEVQQLKCQDVP